MKRIALLISLLFTLAVTHGQIAARYNGFAQNKVVAKFNFSSTANAVTGWVNVVGDPSASVVTASDSRSGSAISISTVSYTDVDYWNPYGSTNSAYVAATGSGWVIEGNSALYRGYFFHYAKPYIPGQENIQITGLDDSKTYKIEILGSRQGASQSTRNSRVYCVDANGTEDILNVVGDYNGDYNFVFTGKVSSSGTIKIHVNQGTVNSFGYLNLLKVSLQ